MCAAPARLVGLDGRKGRIAPGLDADLVVWEPEAERVVDVQRALHQRHTISPYARRGCAGVVHATYLRGRKVFEARQPSGTPGGRAGAPRVNMSSPPSTMSDFTELVDLAAERLGGAALFCNDEFFAERDNLLRAEAAVFIPGKYTDRGKWMDGWETRRRREPGHDWSSCGSACRASCAACGRHGATSPATTRSPSASRGAARRAQATLEGLEARRWFELCRQGRTSRATRSNAFAVDGAWRITHVRLRIYPDGGVARLRVHGARRCPTRAGSAGPARSRTWISPPSSTAAWSWRRATCSTARATRS